MQNWLKTLMYSTWKLNFQVSKTRKKSWLGYLFSYFSEIVFSDEDKAKDSLRCAPYNERYENYNRDCKKLCGAWCVWKCGNAEIDDSFRIIEKDVKSVFDDALGKYDAPGLVQKNWEYNDFSDKYREKFSHKPYAINLPTE